MVRETNDGCLAVSLSTEQYPITVGKDVMTSSDVRCFGHVLLRQHQIGLQLVQNLCSLLKGGVYIGFRCGARYIIRDGWWWSSIERLERGCFDGRMVKKLYQNSARCKYLYQLRGLSLVKQRRYISKLLLITSV